MNNNKKYIHTFFSEAFMQPYYKQLAHSILRNISREDALFHLFEYLKSKIPFERIVCYTVERDKKQMTTFLEYLADINMSSDKSKLEFLFPVKTLEEFYGVNLDGVLNITNAKNDPMYAAQFTQYEFDFSSALVLCLDLSSDMTTYFTCISKEVNAFTKEHESILLEFYILLQAAVVPYHSANPDFFLRMNPYGELATTYEEQLKLCPDISRVVEKIEAIAQWDACVLIGGPTGSGKELIAETIHALSPRLEKPFVRVNCGAIPENLIESELFGYEKGAFTGAMQSHKGYFEQAHLGTIYLDEIGELSKSAQVKLLRVLEAKEIQRIGSDKIVKLDIRIIAATNRDLLKMVQENEFREDLYYRLHVFPIDIPPLQNRPRDLRILTEYFYKFYTQKFKMEQPPLFSEKALSTILNYPWPGNVRELRHTIERALLENLITRKVELDFSFLPKMSSANISSRVTEKKMTVEEIEDALRKCKGKIQGENGVAKMFNMHPATLRSRMSVLGMAYTRKDLEKYKNNS